MLEQEVVYSIQDQAASLRALLNPKPHLAWVLHCTEVNDASMASMQFMMHATVQQEARVLAFFSWEKSSRPTYTQLPDLILQRRQADYLLDRLLSDRQQVCVNGWAVAHQARHEVLYSNSLKRWATRAMARFDASIWAVHQHDEAWMHSLLPTCHRRVWLVNGQEGSIRQTYQAIKKLVAQDGYDHYHIQHHVIVMQAPSLKDSKKIYQNLSSTAKQYLGIDLRMGGFVGFSSSDRGATTHDAQGSDVPWWQMAERKRSVRSKI